MTRSNVVWRRWPAVLAAMAVFAAPACGDGGTTDTTTENAGVNKSGATISPCDGNRTDGFVVRGTVSNRAGISIPTSTTAHVVWVVSSGDADYAMAFRTWQTTLTLWSGATDVMVPEPLVGAWVARPLAGTATLR